MNDPTVLQPSERASRPMLAIGSTLLVIGSIVAVVPLPLTGAPAIRLLTGGLLLLVGAVLLAIAPRRANRLAFISAVLWVMLVLATVRTGEIALRSIESAFGSDAHVLATLASETGPLYAGYPDAERPLQPDNAEDPVIKEARALGRRHDQRVVSVTGGELDVMIWNPSPAGRLLSVLRDVLAPGLLVAAIAITLRLLRRVGDGDPFSRGTSRLVSVLGILLLVGLPLEAMLRSVAAAASLSGSYAFIGLPGDVMSMVPSIASFVPGILLLVVAAAWRVGADLRELEQATI